MDAMKTFLLGLLNNIGAGFKSIFTKFTTIQKVSFAMTLASGILAYGDTHQQITGVPGWMAHDWPLVLTAAAAFYKYGKIFFPDATTYTAAQVQQIAKQAINDHVATLQATGVLPTTTQQPRTP
jgi:hypothetical protein